VRDAAVIGLKDDDLGRRVHALIQPAIPEKRPRGEAVLKEWRGIHGAFALHTGGVRLAAGARGGARRRALLARRHGAIQFPRIARADAYQVARRGNLVFMAFDLLHQDGVDLRHLPLAERKRDLERLCRRAKVPFMRQVQTFPNGQLLFEHCAKFGFEGVVSKRLDRPYVSGPCKCWVKVKCPGWKRENSERFKLFEGRHGR
jgi:hypothetical protein